MSTDRQTDPPTESDRDRSRHWWVLLAAAYLLVAFGWLFHYDLSADGTAYAVAAMVTFLVRVLGVHIGLGALFVALLLSVRGYRGVAVAAVPLIVFLVAPLVDVTPRKVDAADEPGVRVMSANLLDLNDDHAAVITQIRRQDPDVLLLQEYTPTWDRELRSALRSSHPHMVAHERSDSYGLAVYSKTPYEQTGVDGPLELGEGLTPQIRAVIDVDGMELAVYNLHLMMPLALGAHAEQRHQIADLVDELRNEDGATLVAGDLNFTETTPHHDAIVDAGFRSAWDIAGHGRGSTWPARSALRFLPGLRLDHVFVSKTVSVGGMTIGSRNGSDHRPVIVDIRP